MYLKSRFTCPNKKKSWNHYRGVNNKTQLSSKIIPTSSCRLGDSHKKNLPPCHLLLFICSHEWRFAIITGTNHTVQNCKGEFIIKETNNYQMTIISKRNNNKYHDHTQLSINSTYTNTLKNYSPTFPQFQSIMLSMMHTPDLNSQIQCGTIRQEIA